MICNFNRWKNLKKKEFDLKVIERPLTHPRMAVNQGIVFIVSDDRIERIDAYQMKIDKDAADAEAAREAWFAFGEDAVIGGAEGKAIDGAWNSGNELADFAANPPRDGEDRNWRIIDPRRLAAEEEDDDGPGDGEAE